MAMQKLDDLLDWQLKHGSHDFPGPDGGTCINEAALVVAGFSYRAVNGITDLPESFCPVISQFALTLNDLMPEGDTLNRLRPFALRLAGSADCRQMAGKRALYLAMQAAVDFAPLAIDRIDRAAARRLRTAPDAQTALAKLEALGRRPWPHNVRQAVGAAIRALRRALETREAIYTAELVAICATRAAAVDERAWVHAIDALDRVLLIGNQANPIECDLIDQRAAAAQSGQ